MLGDLTLVMKRKKLFTDVYTLFIYYIYNFFFIRACCVCRLFVKQCLIQSFRCTIVFLHELCRFTSAYHLCIDL